MILTLACNLFILTVFSDVTKVVTLLHNGDGSIRIKDVVQISRGVSLGLGLILFQRS